MSPQIRIRCEAEGETLSHVSLSLADAFSYEIVGASPSLKNFLIGWLTLYSRHLAPPLALPFKKVSPFQEKVLLELSRVPFGTTLSYQELAKRCGNRSAARAVGGACKKNPFPLFIPCHRVICTDGSLGGFALDREIKRRLLAFEGKKF